jgi:hypothetical protein
LALERAGATIEHLSIEDEEDHRRADVRVRMHRAGPLAQEAETLEEPPEIESLRLGLSTTASPA